jgi:hypothetical protein
MSRTLRILGVSIFAIVALSAIAASSASAEGRYTCALASGGNPYPCAGTAESELGNDTFITEKGTVECKAHFASTLGAASSTLTVTPTYTNCKFPPFSAKVDMNGCDYTFETPKTVSTDSWTASAQVTCHTAPIRITIPGEGATLCEITVGTQTPGGHVVITNNTTATGGSGDADVQSTFTAIEYNVVKDGFGCPFEGTGVRNNGQYTQHKPVTVTVAGKDIHVGH